MIKLKTEPAEDRMIPQGLRSEILLGMMVADGCAMDCGWAGIRLTSGTEGRHGRKSRHFDGAAVDFTLWGHTHEKPDEGAYHPFVEWLKNRLGPDYDVVLETGEAGNVWVHLEWDPRGPMWR